MTTRKEAFIHFKDEIYQTYHTEENIKKKLSIQIIRINQAIDMNLKTKIIKKLEDLFMERL